MHMILTEMSWGAERTRRRKYRERAAQVSHSAYPDTVTKKCDTTSFTKEAL